MLDDSILYLSSKSPPHPHPTPPHPQTHHSHREMPVFAWGNGYITTSYNANLNKQCEERYPEIAGKLSPLQREAMALFNEIANSDAMKLSIRLERGDVALINNINVSCGLYVAGWCLLHCTLGGCAGGVCDLACCSA